MKKKFKNVLYYCIVCVMYMSCDGQTLSPNKFIFDSKFDSLYKAISNKDTFFFENDKNSIDTFVLTKKDSMISNRVNCFMCPRAAKSIFRNYKQYPTNYWGESTEVKVGPNQGKEEIREVPLISITIYPDRNTNKAYISFKNFHCSIEESLGNQMNDILLIRGRYFTNYYILSSTAKSLIVNREDVQSILVTLRDGIIGYREKSGILRTRIW